MVRNKFSDFCPESRSGSALTQSCGSGSACDQCGSTSQASLTFIIVWWWEGDMRYLDAKSCRLQSVQLLYTRAGAVLYQGLIHVLNSKKNVCVWRVGKARCVFSCKISISLDTAETRWVTIEFSAGTYHRSDTHTLGSAVVKCVAT